MFNGPIANLVELKAWITQRIHNVALNHCCETCCSDQFQFVEENGGQHIEHGLQN